jgi:hypothetical protein
LPFLDGILSQIVNSVQQTLDVWCRHISRISITSVSKTVPGFKRGLHRVPVLHHFGEAPIAAQAVKFGVLNTVEVKFACWLVM